jgi:hypothetical protein
VVLAACGGTSGAPARRPAPDPPKPRPAASAQSSAPHAVAAAAVTASCEHRPPERPLERRRWLSGTIVTEYYPVPERWFDGVSVQAPGDAGRHRVDWLYSANGVSMQGDGIDLAGHHVHIADLGSVGWVNSAGRPTVPPKCGVHWSGGPPAWRAGGWRNASGAVTYPLSRGGWSHGRGHWVGSYGGATFESGASLPLRYYHSVAPGADTPRQPHLHPGVPHHQRRLVRRPGHRGRDHRPPHRRLPSADGTAVRERAAPPG